MLVPNGEAKPSIRSGTTLPGRYGHGATMNRPVARVGDGIRSAAAVSASDASNSNAALRSAAMPRLACLE